MRKIVSIFLAGLIAASVCGSVAAEDYLPPTMPARMPLEQIEQSISLEIAAWEGFSGFQQASRKRPA